MKTNLVVCIINLFVYFINLFSHKLMFNVINQNLHDNKFIIKITYEINKNQMKPNSL